MELKVIVTRYPAQVSEPGTYTIRNVKGPQETKFGQAVILTVTDSSNSERSLFVQYSPEITKNTNLARLIAAFGSVTEKWVSKRIRVTFDIDGKRRIDPATRGR
jgi:hypothetical protein